MRQGTDRTDAHYRRLLAAALALVVLASLMVVAGPRSAWASAPADGQSKTYVVRTCEGGEQEMTAPEYESLVLHNEAREAAGLGYLCVNSILTEAARGHAADMMERDYFGHDTPEGRDPEARIEEAGYSGWTMWGENIAWGSGFKGDSREIFAALMDSPHHRENILKDGFLEVGIGALGGNYNGHPGAGMYAMDFGARAGQAHEYPEALSENGGDATGEPPAEEPTAEEAPPAEDPLAGKPVAGPEGGITPEDQEGTDLAEPTPEPGESAEEERQEVADAEQAICKIFGETRERVIGGLRADAGGAGAGENDPASQSITETKASIADEYERTLLTTSFCDFGEDGGSDEETPEESASPESASPESASPESASPESASPESASPGGTEGDGAAEGTGESTSKNIEQTTIVQQNSGGEAGQGQVDAEEIRRQVEREVRRALASSGAMPGAR